MQSINTPLSEIPGWLTATNPFLCFHVVVIMCLGPHGLEQYTFTDDVTHCPAVCWRPQRGAIEINTWTLSHCRIHLNKVQLCLTLALRLHASQQAAHTRRPEGRPLAAAPPTCCDWSHSLSAQFGNCHFNYMEASTSRRSWHLFIYLFSYFMTF